jgi:hypothetical protein
MCNGKIYLENENGGTVTIDASAITGNAYFKKVSMCTASGPQDVYVLMTDGDE